MSRYYDILITYPSSDTKNAGKTFRQYTSYLNGVSDPGALRVVMDIPVGPYHTPGNGAFLQIMGVDFKDLTQPTNFNGMDIKISGGFQKGLPLANPQQAGLLIQGSIWQAFANWQGTQMDLDFIVIAPMGNPTSPVNFVVNWAANTKFSVALANTLKAAYPNFTQKINISDKLVLNYNFVGYYAGLTQFASVINDLSKQLIGGTGVTITVQGNQIVVFDGTSKTDPRQLAFTDMVGQPTWINPGTVQTILAMRGDLHIGDYIKFPPGVGGVGTVNTTAQSVPQAIRDTSVFQGSFQIASVRHVGDSRVADGRAWITVIDAYPVPK